MKTELANEKNVLLNDNLDGERRTVFVRLKTLDEIERFWVNHRDEFNVAWEGDGSGQMVIDEHEWVFGDSEESIVIAISKRLDGNSEINKIKGMLALGCDMGVNSYTRASLDEAIRYWKESIQSYKEATGQAAR